MKTKDIRKPKRKHGQTVQEIDFLTPLSVDECMEHLESGRSPHERWGIKVRIDQNRFDVDFTNRWDSANPLPMWIEGDLTERPNGLTHVTAEIRHELEALSVPAWMIKVSKIGVFVLNLVLIALYLRSDTYRSGALIFTMISITMYIILTVESRRAKRQIRTLLAWLEDRLDVQRTK